MWIGPESRRPSCLRLHPVLRPEPDLFTIIRFALGHLYPSAPRPCRLKSRVLERVADPGGYGLGPGMVTKDTAFAVSEADPLAVEFCFQAGAAGPPGSEALCTQLRSQVSSISQ